MIGQKRIVKGTLPSIDLFYIFVCLSYLKRLNLFFLNKVSVHKNLRTGEEKTIKYLFEDLSPRAVVFAQSMVRDMDVAKDIVQNTFTKIWSSDLSFDSTYHFRTYLYNSIKNAAINHIEREKKHVRDVVDFPQKTIEYNIIETEIEAEIYRQINMLSPARRDVIVNKLNGMTIEDIAIKLGVSKATVKTHMILAKRDLKIKLKNLYVFLDFLLI